MTAPTAAQTGARVRAEMAFPLRECPECEGDGCSRVACCEGHDTGHACHCARPGYAPVTCAECHGEGEVATCGRCQSYRVSSDDDGDTLVCCACGLGEEGE